MKIIMLDMDGVLNSWQSAYWYRRMLGHDENDWVNYRKDDLEDEEFSLYTKELCPLACGNLRQLIEYHPDIKIVISSTWRLGKKPEWFNRLFKSFKIFDKDLVIGTTPSLNTERGFEIKHWLDNHKELDIKEFVILDDDGDMGPYCGTPNFVQTDGKVGFDYLAMEKVDKLFEGFTLKYHDLKLETPYKMYSKPRKQNYFKSSKGIYYFDDEGDLHTDIHMYEESELFAEADPSV